MFLQSIKTGLLHLKDAVQGMIYALLSYSRAYTAMAPVLAFVLRPALSLTLLSLALIQVWSFIHSPNQNIDNWMISGGSLLGAVLNNTASFGALIMRVQGGAFPFAPWLLVTGFALSSLYRFVLVGISLRRAFEASAYSAQRQHFLQAAVSHGITAVQLACCSAAIVLFNLVPAYSVLIASVALGVVAINLASVVWRALAPESRSEIKHFLGMRKRHEVAREEITCCLNQTLTAAPVRYKRLFTTVDHVALVKNMTTEEAKRYLLFTMNRKLFMLEHASDLEKRRQKKEVLLSLRHTLLNGGLVEKKQLMQHYPRLSENFWCEKSDTECLMHAVDHYMHTLKDTVSHHVMKGGC